MGAQGSPFQQVTHGQSREWNERESLLRKEHSGKKESKCQGPEARLFCTCWGLAKRSLYLESGPHIYYVHHTTNNGISRILETCVNLQELLDFLPDFCAAVEKSYINLHQLTAVDTLGTALTHQHAHMPSLSCCALTNPWVHSFTCLLFPEAWFPISGSTGLWAWHGCSDCGCRADSWCGPRADVHKGAPQCYSGAARGEAVQALQQ